MRKFEVNKGKGKIIIITYIMCICVYRCPRKLEEGARLLDFSATGVISCCGLPDVDTGNVSSGQTVCTIYSNPLF